MSPDYKAKVKPHVEQVRRELAAARTGRPREKSTQTSRARGEGHFMIMGDYSHRWVPDTVTRCRSVSDALTGQIGMLPDGTHARLSEARIPTSIPRSEWPTGVELGTTWRESPEMLRRVSAEGSRAARQGLPPSRNGWYGELRVAWREGYDLAKGERA